MINAILKETGLRRRSQWEPRTLLDWFLHSPLQWLASRIFSLLVWLRIWISTTQMFVLRRNTVRDPKVTVRQVPAVRVVCVSDTHDATFAIPPGDLLIHAGDMTNEGTVDDIQRQIDWLRAQPHTHKVVVCGNHDSWFDSEARRDVDRLNQSRTVNLDGVHFLQRCHVKLDFFGGQRTLFVYGAGDVPKLGGKHHAFQYPRDHAQWDGLIPRHTDVLVTHTPPAFHRDLDGLGCRGLLYSLWRVRPRLHVFGHVHWGRGQEVAFFDHCQAEYECLMAMPGQGALADLIPSKRWYMFIAMVAHGVGNIYQTWATRAAGGHPVEGRLMVNAAMKIGDTNRMHPTVEVVEI